MITSPENQIYYQKNPVGVEIYMGILIDEIVTSTPISTKEYRAYV